MHRRGRLVRGAWLLTFAVATACGFGIDLDALQGGPAKSGPTSDGLAPPPPPNPSDDAPSGIPDAHAAAIGLDVGEEHACAVREGGTVVCWGANGAAGRLGNGDTADSSTPIVVAGLNDIKQVSASLTHSCAVDIAGAVFCWGANDGGQLGDGTRVSSGKPVTVRGLALTALSVSVGSSFSCAVLTDKSVACWGAADSGQLGVELTSGDVRSVVPVTVTGLSDVKTVSAGPLHACALTNAGEVWCWGYNNDLRAGGTETVVKTPFHVPGMDGAASISAGGSHTCVAMTNGTAHCWGSNAFGQIGTGGTSSNLQPDGARIVGGVTDFTAVATGTDYSCGLRKAGMVECWGRGLWGQLGTGERHALSSPAPSDVANVTGVVELSAGGSTTCARLGAGGISCWGSNANGRLGTGSVTRSATPVDVVGLSNVDEIAIIDTHGCARSGTAVSCWGTNRAEALGIDNATITATGTPLKIGAVVGQLSVGIDDTCGVSPLDGGADAGILCWGSNVLGQWGGGAASAGGDAPLHYGGPGYLAFNPALGTRFMCAQGPAGNVVCSGAGSEGQLGNKLGSNFPAPQPVIWEAGTPPTVNRLVAGDANVCALTQSGDTFCWGRSDHGEVGTNSNTDVTVPTKLPFTDAGATVKDMAIGAFHSCALRVDGNVYCWGYNDEGQLGDGTTTSSKAALHVGLAGPATAISAGVRHTCALLDGGTVQCWGEDLYGQVGNGSFALSAPLPQAVAGLSGVQKIACGGQTSCAIKSDGKAVCWGKNAEGQLGDGTSLTVHTALAVVGF